MSGGFVMMPEWLRRRKPSGNAALVYWNLGSFGTFKPGAGIYEECRPSLARLAEECGLSESSVKRALAELVELGAAERRLRFNADGSSAPSVYRLIYGDLVGPPDLGRGSPVDPQGSTGGREGGSPVDPNQEVLTKNQERNELTCVASSDGANKDQKSSSTEPDDPPSSNWRAEDRELFRSIVGDALTSDGTMWTEGTFNADTWYRALWRPNSDRVKRIEWPGRYLDHLESTDGVDDWLTTRGIERGELADTMWAAA